MKKHEENMFLDSDWFCDFLNYQKFIDKIIEFIAGDNGGGPALSQNSFMNGLIDDAEKAAEGRDRILSSEDQSVLKELYQLLIDTVRDVLNGQMNLRQKYSLNEVKRDIWKVYELQNAELERLIGDGKTEFLEKPYEYPEPHIKRYCYNQENRLTGDGEFVNFC